MSKLDSMPGCSAPDPWPAPMGARSGRRRPPRWGVAFHSDPGHDHMGRPGTARYAGPTRQVFTLGIGGPVGSRARPRWSRRWPARLWRPEMRLAVVTNDIYTTEDADFLRRDAVLPPSGSPAVQTGGCPHTAIRDDITANLDAVERCSSERFGDLDLVLVESGGDNLTAVFSRGLVDRQIFVIDVAGGDKVPRKGGPGVHHGGPARDQQDRPGAARGRRPGGHDRRRRKMRGERPFIMASIRQKEGIEEVVKWVREQIASRAPTS
jgi:urease accessory protein